MTFPSWANSWSIASEGSAANLFVVRDGLVFFANFADQRVYRRTAGEAPQAITPAGKFRYSDFILDAARGLLYAVREDHTDESREAVPRAGSLRRRKPCLRTATHAVP